MRRRRNSLAAARFWKNLVPRKDPKISVFWDKWVDFDSDDNVTEPDTDEDAPTTAVPEPESLQALGDMEVQVVRLKKVQFSVKEI